MGLITPFCKVVKQTPSLDGLVLDYGFCFSEKSSTQLGNPSYVLENLQYEPNTDSLIPVPELTIVSDQSTLWDYPIDSYWRLTYPNGYLSGRTLLKWTNVDPSLTYELISVNNVEANHPFIVEIGLLPSYSTSEVHYTDIIFGNEKCRLRIYRTKSAELFFDYGTMTKIASVPLQFKHLMKDLETEFIWIAPYYNGILFSTDGYEWSFVRPFGGLSLEAGKVQIQGSGGIAAFGLHQLTLQDGSITSQTIDTGTPPANAPEIVVHGWKADGNFTSEKIDVSSHEIKYHVTIEPGQQLIGITKIDVNFPPEIVESYTDGAEVLYVKSVNEQIPEDPTEESCEIVLDNQGDVYNGQFKRFDTVKWYFGMAYDDGTSDLVLRNTGIVQAVNIDYQDQKETSFSLICKAPLKKVKDGTNIYHPDYAEWNAKEAIQDFLERKGIPVSRQSIYDWTLTLSPSSDFGNWQPPFGEESWKWLENLVYYLLGGWILTQRDGTIRIEPYPEAEDQTYTDVFTLHAKNLQHLGYRQAEESISEIRNIVLTQGLSPEGEPLFAELKDENSLYNPLASNFVGYPKPLIVRDSALSTQEIVNFSTGTLFERYRKFRDPLEFTTYPRRGSSELYPGALVVLEFDTKPSQGVLVRSVSSTIQHSEIQQIAYGHYTELS